MAASILGALAVAVGAFGAHSLKDILTENGRTDTFKTAVEYHFYHALALLFLGVLMRTKYPNSTIFTFSAYAWFLGILLFSGSLYTLSVLNIPSLGMVTPFGGTFFILGWLLLFLGIKKAG